MGYGPRIGREMIIRGLDRTPSSQKYSLPNTQPKMRKTFGISRDRLRKGVMCGRLAADQKVPGPGEYISDIIDLPKTYNTKHGVIGKPPRHDYYGRELRHSILYDPTRPFPASNMYQTSNDIDVTSITSNRLIYQKKASKKSGAMTPHGGKRELGGFKKPYSPSKDMESTFSAKKSEKWANVSQS